MTTPSQGWDDSYSGSVAAPWDIGRPQPLFVRLADAGLLRGRLLDAGCGTGENTLLAAGRGADAVGVDFSPLAIGQLGLTFDTVTDSGVFHVFGDDDRARYVTSLASVVEPGGTCYLACFSERQPGDAGPRRVRQDELRAAFSGGWDVTEIVPETFEVNPGPWFPGTTIEAWLATIRRT
jgi:cyclopropane fatty-acyl-phospholipid synthase-like methyltransferase